jgi:hypothetical protein
MATTAPLSGQDKRRSRNERSDGEIRSEKQAFVDPHIRDTPYRRIATAQIRNRMFFAIPPIGYLVGRLPNPANSLHGHLAARPWNGIIAPAC